MCTYVPPCFSDGGGPELSIIDGWPVIGKRALYFNKEGKKFKFIHFMFVL